MDEAILLSLLQPQTTTTPGSVRTVTIRSTAARNVSTALRSASVVRPSRSIATQTYYNISTATVIDSSSEPSDTSVPEPSSASSADSDNDAQQASTIRFVALVALAVLLLGAIFWLFRRYKARRVKTMQRRRGHRALRRDVELSHWRALFRNRSGSGATTDDLPEYEGKLPSYLATDTVQHGHDPHSSPHQESNADVASISAASSASTRSLTSTSLITDPTCDRSTENSIDAVTRTRTDGASSFHTDSDANT